jgi:hypothetical protein
VFENRVLRKISEPELKEVRAWLKLVNPYPANVDNRVSY